MDIVRRLTLETAQTDSVPSRESRHRYEFAASLCHRRRVLELRCGDGQGTAIVAARAREVLAIDRDVGIVDLANATVGHGAPNIEFLVADPAALLCGGDEERFEVILSLNGIAALAESDQILSALRQRAQAGDRIIVAVPNAAYPDRHNDGIVGAMSYAEASNLFELISSTVLVSQFAADGSLIVPPAPQGTEMTVVLDDAEDPESATHFLVCANFAQDELQRAHHGRIQATASPVPVQRIEELKRKNSALRRENARLARERLGKGGSAAASMLAKLADPEGRIAGMEHRAVVAERRVVELEAALAGLEKPPAPPVEAIPAVDVIAEAATVPPERPEELDPGEDPNSWEQRRRRAARVIIPWIEKTVPLSGKTVLEYGCGNAAVSCAFAERAGRLIGVDIDSGAIQLGTAELSKRGVANVELELHTVDEVMPAVAARKGEIDVFLCYAVLEHMTIKERLDLLRLAKEVVKPDGAIVICEAPNRLIYFDHHTAQMPFFHLLPDELALDYYHRSDRPDFKQAIDQASHSGREAGLEAITRWGRGVSFHEFEVAFGDLSRHVIASNYDEILCPERPVHPDEVILARYLERWRPDLAPVWSRYWLDLILSPHPVEKRPPFLRPWTAETVGSRSVGWTRWENLLLAGPEARLPVDLPRPTNRLVIGSVNHDWTPVAMLVRQEGLEIPLTTVVHATPHHAVYRSFALPAPAQRLTVEVSRECHIVFVGYED